MTHCAVTGASGYVGSRIAGALAASGFGVVALGRQPGPQGIPWKLDAPSPIADQLRSMRVTGLVHAAWDFTQPKAAQNRLINVEGSRRLIADAVAAGVKDIVFVSTISAFDNATSNYGRAKLEVEALVLAAGGTVVRPGLVWGDGPGGMFGSLRKQVSGGGIVPTIGDGCFPQYLVHEDDLAAAVVRAVYGEFRGKTLTLAHPKVWMLRDLVLRMAAEQGKTVKLIGVPWRIVYSGLKLAEAMGVKLSFRSDSVTSLVRQDPSPAFTSNVPLRPFV